MDVAGKNTIAKRLAKNLEMSYLDSEWKAHPEELKGESWFNAIQGINLQQCQMYRSLDNFVKTRFSLSEYVYSKYYNRISIFDQYTMESCGHDKNHLIYIDLEYPKYKELAAKYRPYEEAFTEEEFNKQRNLFHEAFNKSIIINKVIIQNDGDIDDLERKCINWVLTVEKNKLSNIYRTISGCDACPNMLKSCKEVNKDYARPILPNNYSTGKIPKYVFIGIAPGRGNNTPFSIKAFSHTSGSILHKILEEFDMLKDSYFTNLIKCNTPKDRKFSTEIILNCREHLEYEVDIFETLRTNDKKHKITYFVLGSESKEIVEKYYQDYIPEKDLVFIHHPSSLNYNRTKEALESYKESIRKHV